jgi:hypothetical protein
MISSTNYNLSIKLVYADTMIVRTGRVKATRSLEFGGF